MKINFITGILVILLLVNGWIIGNFVLPFATEIAIVAGISLIIMAIIHDRFVFLYAMSVILSYGLFLVIYAFVISQRPEIELLYVYSHLLFTSFILIYWLLLNHLKKIGYEMREMKRQIQLLQKYNGETNILTLNEFNEQASWLLRTSERRQEEAWLVEIAIDNKNKRIKKSLQESLEKITMETIRQKFDLVTSVEQSIFLLLKDTDEEGVQIMLERHREKVKQELNLIESPYLVKKELVTDLTQLSRMMERTI